MSEASNKNTALFVLGMHRSGTSALARVLNLAGLDLGESVLGAHSCNRRGLWEHEAIVAHDEDLLQSAGSSWFDPRPLQAGFATGDGCLDARQAIENTLEADFARSRFWGLKDPRLCLLTSFYEQRLQAMNIAPRAVQVFRPPEEVAASLYKRDGIPHEPAGLLWLKYNLYAELGTRDWRRAFVAYPEVMSDWRAVLKRIAASLNVEWRLDPEKEAEIDAFLDPALQHQDSAGTWWSGAGPVADMLNRARELLLSAQHGEVTHRDWDALREDFETWVGERTPSMGDPGTTDARQTVDVVVPVYKGLRETKRCLDALRAASNKTCYEVVVINDSAPEPALSEYLRELAAELRISLFENDRNIGFAATVNRAVALHPRRDVVLLNSDTEVANNWLDRIRSHAAAHVNTGTVTPFSNNATICGYPGYCRESDLPEGWTVADLDDVFATANPRCSEDIPTAVGFCMYIKRACWDEVGGFDVQAFGRGYGEENDFCFKATDKGWKHKLAADVFVFHEGGVSFSGIEEKQQAAEEILRRRYPDYPGLVQRYIGQDPLSSFREQADDERIKRRGDAEARILLKEKDGQNSFIMRSLQSSYGQSADLHEEVARLTGRLNEFTALYERAEQFVREREQDIERLEKSNQTLQSSAEELKGYLRDREGDIAQLRDALSAHETALRERESDLRQALREVDVLREQLARQAEQISRHLQQIKQTQAELESVYASRSWKITRPLRRSQAWLRSVRSPD